MNICLAIININYHNSNDRILDSSKFTDTVKAYKNA